MSRNYSKKYSQINLVIRHKVLGLFILNERQIFNSRMAAVLPCMLRPTKNIGESINSNDAASLTAGRDVRIEKTSRRTNIDRVAGDHVSNPGHRHG